MKVVPEVGFLLEIGLRVQGREPHRVRENAADRGFPRARRTREDREEVLREKEKEIQHVVGGVVRAIFRNAIEQMALQGIPFLGTKRQRRDRPGTLVKIALTFFVLPRGSGLGELRSDDPVKGVAPGVREGFAKTLARAVDLALEQRPATLERFDLLLNVREETLFDGLLFELLRFYFALLRRDFAVEPGELRFGFVRLAAVSASMNFASVRSFSIRSATSP